MKERITYIQDADNDYHPSQLQVNENALHVKNLKASREQRFTFGFEELPRELQSVLSELESFHLRWASQTSYASSSPLNSRISAGLHIFLAPKPEARLHKLCDLLKRIFGSGLKCGSIKDSFTPTNSSKPSSTSLSLDYHQNLPSVEHLLEYIRGDICGAKSVICLGRLPDIENISSLDLDYDLTSQSIITSFHQTRLGRNIDWSTIDTSAGSLKTEIGVLASEEATETDHQKLGGFLIVLGEDSKPKPTLFQFPSRHHSMPRKFTYSTAFKQPSGLHPTLRLQFPSSLILPPSTSSPDTCSLYAYLTLPSTIFPDKYQLANELLLKSMNLRRVVSVSGYTDLEAPEYAVSAWGSSMLVELAPTTESSHTGWHADVPLHLRYLPPSDRLDGTSPAQIPWPVVFWACTAGDETGPLTGNPFDRTHLGYDEHFSDRTVFYHLQPDAISGRLIEVLKVPVLHSALLGSETGLLEMGTGAVVLVGWIWVVWLLFRGWYRSQSASPKIQEKKRI